MAQARRFEFELYRVNVADADGDMFEQHLPSLSGNDAAIIEVLKSATQPDYNYENTTRRARFRWDVREFVDYSDDAVSDSRIVGITLARSVIEELSDVVTNDGIEAGISQSVPPRSDHIDLIFHMKRHLVGVERYSVLTQSGVWREALHDILDQAARAIKYRGRVELEPVPRKEEIMTAFRSFERLTRLRLWLRLPSPELSRHAAMLYKQMEDGGVKEYLADMRNSKGLVKNQGELPEAAAEVAQAGYKKGSVRMEGVRDGKFDKTETGTKAARGTASLRDFVRGMKATAKTKETQTALTSILGEMDRIAPPPEPTNAGRAP